MNAIGKNIRILRQMQGVTQTRLAEEVGVAPAYISQIEANQRVPSLKVTRRIGNVLGIEMSVLVREADPRLHEGRLSDSEKLDLLRTLIMAIEGESRSAEEAAGDTRSLESRDFVATELYSEPSFNVVLREFSATGVFGREFEELDVECHVVLGGRVRVVDPNPTGELSTGECLALSSSGSERLLGGRGARVLSVYSPRVTLDTLVKKAEAEDTIPTP